jgi:yecA family protein
MKSSAQNQSLTETELARLQQFLSNCKGGRAMNVEELDGFFAALVAGFDVVMPSEYLPQVFGSEREETHQFEHLEEAHDILALLMRHWNDIAGTLLDLSPFLRQTLKTQDAANGVKMPSKGGWSHGFVSTAVHEGVEAGGASAAGDGGVNRRGGAGF